MGKKDKRERERKQKGKRQNPFDNNNGKKRKGRGKGKTKQDKNWDKYFLEFQEWLKPKGIYMRDVEGDGNCLFRSVADFVDGDEKEHDQYRRMAVDYITKNKEYFAMFLLDDENIDEYIKDMDEDGTWGGHFELVALSNLLNVKFCLHIKDHEPVIVKSSEKDLRGNKVVHLAYHVDEHYSSVRKIGDEAKEPAEPIRLEVKDDEDGSSSDSESDSTEGSDRGVSKMTKDVEKLHINDRKNKNKNKGKYEEEEYKKNDSEDYRGKGKNKKNEKEKKEDKGKGKKKNK